MVCLLESSGDRRGDRIVEGVVGIFGQVFPGRIRGVYLRGSRASGTSTAGSDLDLFVVFKDRFADRAEFEAAQALCGHCALLTSVLLEIVVVGERQLQRAEGLAAALNLKLATRLLSGEDIRPGLPDFDRDTYVRSVVHTPYFSYTYPEQPRRAGFIVFPLGHIDPDGPFLGYDTWIMPGPNGDEVASTKLLVASVGWTATALIALDAGLYVADKAACAALYQQHIGGPWAELVTDVHDLCRKRWHYRIPTDEADRQVLRDLCERALGFQNHFLSLYRGYLLGELESRSPDRQLLALQRLGQIIYPDAAVIDAITELLNTTDATLRETAATTLTRYQTIHHQTATTDD